MYAAVDESTPPDIATAIFMNDQKTLVQRRLFRPGHSSCMPFERLARDQTLVLIADDDPSIRRLIIAALRRDGYQFIEAPSGKEALDLMRSEQPDVLVLDLMMPGVSGWDVLKMRSEDPELLKIPVIVISASRSAEVAETMDQGICAFLPKPFDIVALTSLVRNCVPQSGS